MSTQMNKSIADKRTYYSVMKNVEVVGEAAYMLTLLRNIKICGGTGQIMHYFS